VVGPPNRFAKWIVDFHAGFDEPAAGVGYRYGVRTWTLRLENGQYSKNATTVPTDDKVALSSLLQKASMAVYLAIKDDFNKAKAQSNGGHYEANSLVPCHSSSRSTIGSIQV
jgi:hypothetical protein